MDRPHQGLLKLAGLLRFFAKAATGLKAPLDEFVGHFPRVRTLSQRIFVNFIEAFLKQFFGQRSNFFLHPFR